MYDIKPNPQVQWVAEGRTSWVDKGASAEGQQHAPLFHSLIHAESPSWWSQHTVDSWRATGASASSSSGFHFQGLGWLRWFCFGISLNRKVVRRETHFLGSHVLRLANRISLNVALYVETGCMCQHSREERRWWHWQGGIERSGCRVRMGDQSTRQHGDIRLGDHIRKTHWGITVGNPTEIRPMHLILFYLGLKSWYSNLIILCISKNKRSL